MKAGFMCEDDYDYELPEGLGAFLFPTLAAAHKYCPSQVEVEVIPLASTGSSSLGNRGHQPYFMCEADLCTDGAFPEAGAPIADSIDWIWRRTSHEQRTLVAVRLRVIRIFSRNRLPAKAFVYEELYERLGLFHPGVWTKH